MLLREGEVYRVNRHKGGFSIKISLERTESCCSPSWMARRSRKRERETEKEVQKGWLNAARAQINRRVCGSQWGKLLTSSRSLRYSSHRTTPILFEFVQLRPRFLHNANYNLCAIPRPPFARVCVHHFFIPFSRFIFIEGPVCVHFFLAAEYRVAESYICRLRFDTRFFVPSTFFLSFFFFLFLPRTKKNIAEFTLCLNLFDQRFPILSTRCSHLLESESLKKIM